MAEDLRRAGLPERLGDVRRDDHGAERHVSRRDAFRDGNEVRLELVALAAEPFAEPAEARDHLVDDEEHVVAHFDHAAVACDEEHVVRAADLLDAREVPGRRRQHASRADYGLADERGDMIRPEPVDDGRKRIGVVPGNVLDVGDELAERGRVRRYASERRSVCVDAVVRERARDDRALVRPAGETPVRAGELAGRVDRVGAAARGEEHLGIVHRRKSRDAAGELFGRPVRERAERVVGGKLPHLARGRVCELGAPVPDVAEPERGRRVEVLAPRVVPHARALAADDRERVLADAAHVRERVPERRFHSPMLRRLGHVRVSRTPRARARRWLREPASAGRSARSGRSAER